MLKKESFLDVYTRVRGEGGVAGFFCPPDLSLPSFSGVTTRISGLICLQPAL